MSKVFAVKCVDYNEQNVQGAIDKVFSYLDSLENIIKKGDTVALKVNLVCGASPDKMCTTHPMIVGCIAKKIVALGAKCIIVDSPGGPYTAGHLKSVYAKTGMSKVCEDVDGVSLNTDFTHIILKREENLVAKNFEFINALDKADVIINISKFKTHTYMGYTGCVKNMFGAIPGLVKVEMHSKYVDQHTFGDMLVDIVESIKDKTKLHILDGVVGMEGQGPTSGTPKNIGYILASENPYELDLVQCKMMADDVMQFPLIECMKKRNLINQDLSVQICGDVQSVEKLEAFDVPTCEVYNALKKGIPPFLQPLFHKLMTRRPTIKKSKCKGCKKCFEHCPVHAICMEKRKDNKMCAKIDYQKCIRCFCCQELCPFHVVKIKTGILHKVIRFRDKKRVQSDKTKDK